MRIALLMKRYSLLRGGGEYDLVRLSGSLADRGHDVHLFVNDVEGEADPRLTLHRVPMVRAWSPLKIWTYARNAPRVVRSTGLRFDVVHAMTQTWPSDIYWNGGGLQVNWLRARYGPGALVRARLHPRHAANLAVEERLFRPGNYRFVVCLSKMERGEILGRYRVPEDRFRVIPNGVDPERFCIGARRLYRDAVRAELDLGAEERMVLFVGTDGLRKGLPQLLAGLGAMDPPFAGRLVVAGNDPPSRWQPDVDRNGLSERVRFHGREARVERLYAAADLTVLASLFDGYGNVIPEAMACGCPVLTARSVGAADFVQEGKTGWILEDCRDTPAYAARLHTALVEADLETMGEAAAEAVSPTTWDWTVDRLEELYREVAAEKA